MKKLQLLAITMLLSMPCAMTFTSLTGLGASASDSVDAASASASSSDAMQKLTAAFSAIKSEAASLKEHVQDLSKKLKGVMDPESLTAAQQSALKAATAKLKTAEAQATEAVSKVKSSLAAAEALLPANVQAGIAAVSSGSAKMSSARGALQGRLVQRRSAPADSSAPAASSAQ